MKKKVIIISLIAILVISGVTTLIIFNHPKNKESKQIDNNKINPSNK